MTILTIFLLGIVFAVIGLPFLQSIGDIIYGFTELIKANLTLSITRYAIKVAEIKERLEPCHTQAIGFQYSELQSELDDFPEEDKLHGRIGF